ncbi:uncharacterized protein LOC136071124 [Quercus suber]|uniref:uncharacterized protein LOC136071124 n=1 Tax=Quercus suber TaxID=58331 RepID=UPI0032DFED8F
MDMSQSLNAHPFFDGSNYAFWKMCMRAFLCFIDEIIWDAVENGWTRPEAAKSTWDKTTYEGTKKVKDPKLQMLTTHFKELKMSKDESFDSFYGKLNEVVIGKFNLGEKMEDSKVIAIEESKDLDEIKIEELIGSLQTYKLSLSSQRKRKSLALKTINGRVEAQDSLDVDEIEKEVAYLAKNFRKFLKFKKDRKSFEKGKFSNFKKDKKDFKKKDSKDSSPCQAVTCYECEGHGQVKKECPTYLKAMGKVFATTLSNYDLSNLDSEESCDGEGNYSASMAIAPVDSLEDLRALVEEFGEHTETESLGAGKKSDNDNKECIYEGAKRLQESYNSLLEKTREYARVAKVAIRKMKKAKQDYKSVLVRYKEKKCKVEAMNEELTNAYSRIKFLELEVIQANVKVERVASKKLNEVLAYQKPSSDKSGLGYTGESSSSTNVFKEMKFVKAKEPVVSTPIVENVKVEKKPNVIAQKVLTKPPNPLVAKPKTKGKSLPKSQRDPQTQHFCHHCGI